MKLDMNTILADYPAPYLYYHDSQSWTLYKNKSAFTADNGELSDEARRELIIAEGDDCDTPVGYCPALLVALCAVVGIETGSA